MTREEYWDLDPYLAVSFRKAHELKSERENGDAWWQGVYIRDALFSALTATMPGIKKKVPYPTKPYRITPLTKEEKEEEARKEREKAVRSFTAWKDAWDKKNGG